MAQNHKMTRSLLIGLLAIHGCLRVAAEAESATLTVQVDKPGVRISPTLYGIFFEEINCAGDGGLYAEMVRNRSFEDASRPEHWSLITSGSARGEIAIDTERPMSSNNPNSLRLKV